MDHEEKSALVVRRPGEQRCPQCGASFVCGMKAGVEHCWCADLPPLEIDETLSGCLCPDCLQQRSRNQPAPT